MKNELISSKEERPVRRGISAKIPKAETPSETIAPQKRTSKSFPIVGIGASAGGLEAFTEFLQNLPADTGMAFVLVQHLDPVHESALTQLLARTTSMNVAEVTNRMEVERNHVYVIPPNVCMEIVGGVLKLHPRKKTGGGARSIDIFFESLAQDQQERAIGIVLSGTATDGTQGLELIKAEGGITFAQDDSAKYDSMPRSAVAAGCVDFTLSPREIARELGRIAKHPLVARERPGGDTQRSSRSSEPHGVIAEHLGDENAYKKILLLLRNYRGVDFSVYKPNTLQRRIARRMVLNKKKNLGDYAEFLKGNAKELDPLYSDILINVTNFFRNEDAYEVLKRKVFPSLLENPREDESVRVWSLACSTGQEPYSIAMAYTEFCDNIPRAPKLQVFATDINEAVLEKARLGLYSRCQVADLSPQRLKRFFVEEKGGFRVSKPMRDLCVFARQNILSDPPFSRMDLISCRNLLIYLDVDSHKRIFPNLHYALKPGGFLFLGASESVGSFTNLFSPVDKKQKIFLKKPSVTNAYRLPISESHPAERKGGPVVKRNSPAEAFLVEPIALREADRLMVKQFAPPSVLIDANFHVLQFRGATKEFLEPPVGKATFDLLKMVRTGLLRPLRTALNLAKKTDTPVSRKDVRWEENARTRQVTFEIIPLKNLKVRCYLILFNESSATPAGRPAPLPPQDKSRSPNGKATALSEKDSRRIADLELELSEARDYALSLQEQHEAATEDIQAASEELQSANEELQSINEELETSKEELESTNEELTTVNEELAHRNTELNRVNSDLINLQNSTRLSIVLLGRDLCIRHFSPRAEKQFNLVGGDVGRPFGKVRHDLELPGLEDFIADAIDKVRERECEVRDKQGRWHFLHIRPYISLDNKVDGAVLVLTDITDLKESQQAVTAERDFAESILRTATDPFLVLDDALRVERANQAFYTAFKVTPGEVVGRTVFELDHGHWNVPKLRELLNDILPRHSFFNNFEVSTKFEHLGHRTMLLNARCLSETSGQPARILLGIQDITELLHYQAELRHSELRFRRLFEASKDGLLIINPETCQIIDANPSVSELLGYPHEALLGKQLFQIGVFKDEHDCHAAHEEMLIKGFARYENLVLETKTGQRRELEFVSNLYREGARDVIQCHIHDVTERKLAERKFRGLLESGPDAMIITNKEGTIELVNAQTEKMFGYARGELLGNPVEILIPARFHDVHPGHRQAFMSDPRARSMGAEMELLGLRKDGSEFPVEISLSPVESESGVLISAAVRDITARKKVEETLRLAQAELADRARHLETAVAARTADLTAINHQLESFVYSIAHDLRAPLRAMQGFSALLVEEEPALTESGRDRAERINKAAQYMDALLHDLLAFSRISQQRVEMTSVNLDQLVESVLARLQSEIHEKNATVENLGPWPLVLAHEATLTQALFNLASNALKFLKPGVQPRLRLWTEDKGDRLRIWVEDNGIGIEIDHRDEIFRLFSRLHGTKYPGTGLGLAIVREGVERMGGHVGVESKPGEGSRFWIELKKP